MAKLEIELSEFDALRDAKNKAENDLIELKQSHKEEISDLKGTIKDLEKKSRVIIKHENKYFYKTKIDKEIIRDLKDAIFSKMGHSTIYYLEFNRMIERGYNFYQMFDKCIDMIVNEINDICIKTTSDMIPAFSEHDESDQYIGFDDIKLEVERELKDQYINNQKKIKENLEQQIKNYEEKYQRIDADVKSKYNSEIRILENKLNSSQEEINKLNEAHKEEADKLKESHKEEVDKLKEELKEAQKTQEEKILEAEEKLKEAQEALNKLTNKSNKKWYQFWK